VEESNVDLVNEFVGGDVTSWIPKASLHWVQLIELSSFGENVAPRLLTFWVASHVEDGNLLWPLSQFVSLSGFDKK
jgi:hypothetical protein